MNKMQKIMIAAVIIDLVIVLVIRSKFQEIEQSLLYINGAVMLVALFIGLANLIVIIQKRKRNFEAVYRNAWFIPLIASLCVFSLVPSSIKSIATTLTMAVGGIIILLTLLIWFLIQRIGKKK